jgi:DNA-binding CsgD family transcriptional regulator
MGSVSLEKFHDLFGRKSHGLATLDRSGNIALLEPDTEQTWRLVVNWKNIRINDPLQNAKLSRLFRACIEYDERSDKPLPPPVKLETKTGCVVFVDAIPLPSMFRDKMDGARSLIYIREVECVSTSIREILQQEFSLTPSEVSIADMLTEGLSLKLVARKLHVSIWTARSHLRAIFQKTNTHRQAELVSLLMRLAS